MFAPRLRFETYLDRSQQCLDLMSWLEPAKVLSTWLSVIVWNYYILVCKYWTELVYNKTVQVLWSWLPAEGLGPAQEGVQGEKETISPSPPSWHSGQIDGQRRRPLLYLPDIPDNMGTAQFKTPGNWMPGVSVQPHLISCLCCQISTNSTHNCYIPAHSVLCPP